MAVPTTNMLGPFKVEVSAVVTDPAQEAQMSENEVEAAVTSAPADPADPAEAPAVEPEDADAAALVADDPADEVEAEVELNADGFPAVAGELFGGPDANQAVHETSNEGFLVESDDEDA